MSQYAAIAYVRSSLKKNQFKFGEWLRHMVEHA